jgi:regulatory protein
MAGRRGARSGRGWDAIPPRPTQGESPDGEPGSDNSGGRRRSPGGSSSGAFGASGSRAFGDGRRSGAGGRRSGSGGGRSTGDDGERRAGKDASERPPEPPRSESEVARDICLRQLAVRPRTRAELAKTLARKEISEEVIAEVLDRYDEVGIIDDAAFARMWVSTRHQGRGLARRALANELRQHGVESEVATEALETLDDEAEATTARALVDRKLRSARGTPDQVFRRLVGMLARKGYPAGIAIQAVKEALAARDEEAAEFADQIDADALADEATDTLS